MTPHRQRMLEDLQIRRNSPTTIRICVHCMAEFAQHFGNPPDRLGAEQIRQYQLFLIKEKTVARPTFVQVVCAPRFFYTHTLNRKISIERIPFPRRERKLPLILSREEIKELLAAAGNLRTRTLLAILYGCGLRVIRRFLLHVLPCGLVRIRQFGFLANRVQQHKLAQCRTLIALCQPRIFRSEFRADVYIPDANACPICKQGRLMIIEQVAAESIPFLDTSGSNSLIPSLAHSSVLSRASPDLCLPSRS